MITLTHLVRRLVRALRDRTPGEKERQEIIDHIERFERATGERLADLNERIADLRERADRGTETDADDQKEA